MYLKLKIHGNKGAIWDKMSFKFLYKRLNDEVKELGEAKTKEDIINEAADVANFAAMIADNARRMK